MKWAIIIGLFIVSIIIPTVSNATEELNMSVEQKKEGKVDFNENGDLVVRYGYFSMVLAYNPPEEPYKPQDNVRVVMLMNQEPQISGISIKLKFPF